LQKIPGIIPQKYYPGTVNQNYLCYACRYVQDHFSGVPREKVVEALKAEGIPVSLIYPPFNKEAIIEDNLNSRAFRTVFSKERLAK
jgi:dTDP-4-amino-4,6-dideoxygalactose transaminase